MKIDRTKIKDTENPRISTITADSTVKIPYAWLSKLGWKTGDFVERKIIGNKIIIKKIKERRFCKQ